MKIFEVIYLFIDVSIFLIKLKNIGVKWEFDSGEMCCYIVLFMTMNFSSYLSLDI